MQISGARNVRIVNFTLEGKYLGEVLTKADLGDYLDGKPFHSAADFGTTLTRL